jgi:hypothetical protein
MGKSTISMVIFNSKLLNYQRVWYDNVDGMQEISQSEIIPCLSHQKYPIEIYPIEISRYTSPNIDGYPIIIISIISIKITPYQSNRNHTP